MRSPPSGLATERLREALAEGWRLRVASLEYVPEGGGSHHWKLTDEDCLPHFVTVDDLEDKDWLADTREAVFEGLERALATASELRDSAGLQFVVAPVGARDALPLHRIDSRYTVAVFPFLAGRSYPFGPYADAELRERALDMIIAVHRCTPVVRDRAPDHVLRFGGQRDLSAFLIDRDRPWDGGPFSQPAHRLLAAHTRELTDLVAGFHRLVDLTASARAEPVITHGEPHPGNLMSVDGRLFLLDWDTAALAPPERDLFLIAATGARDLDRYQRATGRHIDAAVITLYRLRWYLDDLGSAVRLFRNRHGDTPDTRRWRDGLAPRLAQLPVWLNRLD